MNLTPDRVAELEVNLKENGLIDIDDRIVEAERGDYWEKFLFTYTQIRGFYYFTEKSIVFVGGLLGSTSWSVKYKNIKDLKPATVGPFLPLAFKLFTYDEKKGKDVSHKVAIVHKKQWMAYLEEKRRIGSMPQI